MFSKLRKVPEWSLVGTPCTVALPEGESVRRLMAASIGTHRSGRRSIEGEHSDFSGFSPDGN